MAETFQSMLGILKDLADADPTELGEVCNLHNAPPQLSRAFRKEVC